MKHENVGVKDSIVFFGHTWIFTAPSGSNLQHLFCERKDAFELWVYPWLLEIGDRHSGVTIVSNGEFFSMDNDPFRELCVREAEPSALETEPVFEAAGLPKFSASGYWINFNT